MSTRPRWCWTSSATTRPQFNWGSRSGTRTSSSSRQVYCRVSFIQTKGLTIKFTFVSKETMQCPHHSEMWIVVILIFVSRIAMSSKLLLKVGWTRTMPSWSCSSSSTPVNLPQLSLSRSSLSSNYSLSEDRFQANPVPFVFCLLSASYQVVTPYFPYSKGDQKSSLRSPISSKLIANMLKRSAFP